MGIWIAAAAAGVFAVGFYWLGFIAGRDAAEREYDATLADLRVQLRALQRAAVHDSTYIHDVPGRPE